MMPTIRQLKTSFAQCRQGEKGSSISRILKVANKILDHDYANKLIREYSQEGNQIDIKIKEIKKEDFVKMLQEYLGVESIEKMLEIIDTELKDFDSEKYK